MAKSARTYQREIHHLKKLLEAVEWYMPTYNGSPSCPNCGAQEHHGHHDGCELAVVLKRSDSRRA